MGDTPENEPETIYLSMEHKRDVITTNNQQHPETDGLETIVIQENKNDNVFEDEVARTNSLYIQGNNTNDNDITYRTAYINNIDKNNTNMEPNKLEECQTNIVITSKYTITNFIPKFLFQRLSQIANFYFLLVGAGQIIPAITSTDSLPFQWMVLSIVLGVDAIFAAIEDREKHLADKKLNSIITRKFINNTNNINNNNNYFIEIPWSDVKVGDILLLYNNETVPADLLLLASHENNPNGICFLETKSLDGETNLKVHQSLDCIYPQLLYNNNDNNMNGQNNPNLHKLKGKVIYEKPNHDIHSFYGHFIPDTNENTSENFTTVPIDAKNILLRGTTIRNTTYIYGFVLNIGNDTKIYQNNNNTNHKKKKKKQKISRIMRIVTKGIYILMGLLLLLCFLGALVIILWLNRNNNRINHYYLFLLNLSGSNPFYNGIKGFFIYFGYYWILIASFVPITLYVSITVIKNYQTYFINRDIRMYYENKQIPAQVRNSDLNDELGQISHIFTDKTGTLTDNIMDFRKMSIKGKLYGKGTTDIGRKNIKKKRESETNNNDNNRNHSIGNMSEFSSNTNESELKNDSNIPNVNFLDPENEFKTDLGNNYDDTNYLFRFLRHLAVCHTVIVDNQEGNENRTNNIVYSASSPDELALVSGASFLGLTFTKRTPGLVTVLLPDKITEKCYEILEIIEFTSTRKRMTVIFRDTTNTINEKEGQIYVLCKGADSILLPRCNYINNNEDIEAIKNKTIEDLEFFASEGLRTLVLAERKINSDQYNQWSKKYKELIFENNNINKNINYADEIEALENEIETNLELIGCTAIEDKLQDKIPLSLSLLLQANIKIWVLTGDKMETAINVAFACQLINNYNNRITLNSTFYPTEQSLFSFFLRYSYHNDTNNVIIIDGSTLKLILENRKLIFFFFFYLTKNIKTVICCRVSPQQKQQIVYYYKYYNKDKIVLAIGDGANDVGMLKEADVGVGISGQEGLAAVNNSDYSIGQFRFLVHLLLLHGYNNYFRMSIVVLYIIYKNILVYFTLFLLSIYNISGLLYYNNMWINGYNIFWTSLPIILFGVFEKKNKDSIMINNPYLYNKENKRFFTMKKIVSWIITGIYHAFFCTLIPLLLFSNNKSHYDSNGNTFGYHVLGGLVWCNMIFLTWLKLCFYIVHYNYLMFIGILVFSFFFWILSGIVISNIFSITLADNDVFPYIYYLPEFYIQLFLTMAIALFIDLFYKIYKKEYKPEYFHILQENDRFALNPNLVKLKEIQENIIKDESIVLNSITSKIDDEFYNNEVSRHRGFSFSTPHLDNRFINPIRDLILFPVIMTRRVTNKIKRTNNSNILNKTDELEDDEQLINFILYLNKKSIQEQEVYEIQRYQIFIGWGSTNQHLLLSDPPQFTNREMTIGSDTFPIICNNNNTNNNNKNIQDDEWILDPLFGDEKDGNWEYSSSFRHFLKNKKLNKNQSKIGTCSKGKELKDSINRSKSHKDGKLYRNIKKLVGRCVRRRRWIRKIKF